MIKGEIVAPKDLFAGMTPRIYARLQTAIVRLSVELQAYIKQSKLSGQVLKNRTGTLRRSINRRVVTSPGSIRAYVGTNVKYARPHEYGFTGTVSVREHLRMQKLAWGKPMKNPREVTVKAHPMKMNLPMRSFLRSALKDKRDRIIGAIEAAIAGKDFA